MGSRVLRLAASLTLIAAPGLVGCGDGGGGSAASEDAATAPTEIEPSPAEAREALEDTSVKPDIPRPTGSPPRRLAKEEIVRGRGRPAMRGDRLTVHYAYVSFSTGEEFGASWNRGRPYSFTLGGGHVIEGWDRGLVGMRKGGRRKLTVPPELAYGAEGSAQRRIGPNETLVFVIDLLEVRRRPRRRS
jgi:peptidylprolyl isomerase